MKRILINFIFCLPLLITAVASDELPQYEWRSCNTGIRISTNNTQMQQQNVYSTGSSRYSSNVQAGIAEDPYGSAPAGGPRRAGRPGPTTEEEKTDRPGVDEPIGDIPCLLILLFACLYMLIRTRRPEAE